MDSPSSTSSSDDVIAAPEPRRMFPLAALIVLLLVVVLDRSVYCDVGLWHWLDARMTGAKLLEQGLVQDRIELLSIPANEARPLVFLVGSSRLNRGFRLDGMPPELIPDVHIAKLAHPQFFPFEIRSAIPHIVAQHPQVVLIALSELETHARLKLVPGSSFGDLSAIVDLAQSAGMPFVLERHVMLSRIALEGAFNTYHYRGVFNRAGLGRLRHFERDRRLKVPRFPERSTTYLDGEQKEISPDALGRIVEDFDQRFGGRGSIIEKAQFGLLRSMSRGEHANINESLIRASLSILRDAGVEVILIEPPIYPGAKILYDETIRQDFLRFAEGLSREFRIRFVRLEEQPRYTGDDFGDLTHLAVPGARKLTRVILSVLRDELQAPHSD